MRKSINGLCEVVLHQFKRDPREAILFVFCNRQKNRIKLLVWEANGFRLHFKSLEKGSILWPDPNTEEPTMGITIRELEQLIHIPRIRQKIKRREVWKNH